MHALLYSVFEYKILRFRFKMGAIQIVRTSVSIYQWLFLNSVAVCSDFIQNITALWQLSQTYHIDYHSN